jgi:PHD/YefM family antitoxin component YafN of YafNO toxin-antitoxin module
LGAKRISTYRLAHELLYLHWYGKGKPVTVSSKVAKAARLSDRSKWNALAELERLGLIEVNRKPRRSPRVVLLHTRTSQT